jgi:hypothetical protein
MPGLPDQWQRRIAWRGRTQQVEEEPVMRVLTGMPAGVVGVEAGGKLSAGDYAKVLAPALATATKASEQEEAIAWAAATPEKP